LCYPILMAIKILIVEDDQDILDILVYVLQEDGYEVVSSTNSSILNDVARIAPDVILLDEWLSEHSKGSEFCRILKGNAATSAIPVIMLSACTPIERVVTEAGADGHITKPFDINSLSKVIESVINTAKNQLK
jgi:two-component system phosphate regulon response regulator PhoB